jgi:uncharacterized protein YerC|tara:strand:+ start:1748 stop:2503 length:756 start_codon:yes stop_codon:yes gene_type:complete
MGRKAKKGSSRYYFTDKTEKAIIRYNNSDNPVLRNKIYNEHIHKAFDKLCENIIHTFKFYYFDVPSEDVKHEVMSFLVMNMHKFKEGKGKAFSYFSIVAKNYLILHNNKNYKSYKQKKDVSSLEYGDNMKITEDDFIDETEQFLEQTLTFWDENINKVFKRHRDIMVVDSILELFRRRMFLENFNKKALYILIREMTGSNTQHITRVVNTLKKYHKRLMYEYTNFGQVDVNYTGSLISDEPRGRTEYTYNF